MFKEELGDQLKCQQVIISGGVKNFLDGCYLINKLALPSVYGQASGFREQLATNQFTNAFLVQIAHGRRNIE